MTARGTRLSPDWQPSEEEIEYACKLGFDVPALGRIAEDYKDYWVALPGARGLKLDWTATWRVWLRREADKRWGGGFGGRNPPRGGGNPPRSSILDIANELSLGLRARDA